MADQTPSWNIARSGIAASCCVSQRARELSYPMKKPDSRQTENGCTPQYTQTIVRSFVFFLESPNSITQRPSSQCDSHLTEGRETRRGGTRRRGGGEWTMKR